MRHTLAWTKQAPCRLVSVVALAACLWLASGVVLAQQAEAVPAAPNEVELEQPDGDTFEARPFGDEWANGFETPEGYTVVPEDDEWRYAVKEGGELVPGDRVVGEDSPRGLPRRLRERPDPKEPFGPAGAADHDGDATGAASTAPSMGTHPTLVLLVRPSNQPSVGTKASKWHKRFFGSSGSVRAYYKEASYGKLDMAPAAESHGTAGDGVVGWLSVARKHPNTANTGEANRLLVRDAIKAADPHVSFARYDKKAPKGVITPDELHIVTIVAGYEASYDSTCGKSVWGHNWALFGDSEVPVVDGVRVADGWKGGGYSQFGEMHCDHMATIGIIAHELGHDLGWPDLYDIDNSSAGIGSWSVMAYGSWNSLSGHAGSLPVLPDASSKYYQGWVKPVRITGTQTGVKLKQAASNPSMIRLRANANGVDWRFGQHSGKGQYFLVENRQRTTGTFDASLPGCGLLVWHIDETRSPYNDANANDSRRLVDLEEADGLDQLDTWASFGDRGDPYPGSSGNRKFTKKTVPDSRLYSGKSSGVAMSKVSTGCAKTMAANFIAP